MLRLLAAALAALLLAPAPAGAQQSKLAAPSSAPPTTAPGQAELDARTRAAIQAAVDKAKEDLRNEVRAEMQGAQSAAEFLGTVSEGPKLEFFEVHGYFRVRPELFYELDLGRPADPAGYYLFPLPALGGHTLATANMRFRVEPTLNVSEHVRIRAQFDILDNYALGSSVSKGYISAGSPYPVPFWAATRVLYTNDPTADRAPILPKRVWGEAQTPVGLLSFGRMPNAWGLGMLSHAGGGLDDDLGDTVDRLQFAIAPVSTPIGSIVFVPILDFDAEGVLNNNQQLGAGQGQPFDAEQSDDARTYAIKIVRLDTDDELRRKLERGETSINFGAYYNYRTARWLFPPWYDPSLAGGTTGDPTDPGNWIKRDAYGHILDLWFRWRAPRLRVEAEFAGIYGNVGNPNLDPNVTNPTKILIRQYGGVIQTDYDPLPNKFSFGLDLGLASGDDAPGFGNVPDRTPSGQPGDVEGAQWNTTSGDRTIRNFRFNPAYRVDLVFWREIMGNVTDAWYLRPHLRWDILPGLNFQAAILYSQAIYASSTPSAETGHAYKPLGFEIDGMLRYGSGDGFNAWLDYGLFQPLSAFNSPTKSNLSRANAIRAGLAIKF